nr:MAG TPA: Lysozyme [Caudoviricetes sp.]
MRINEKGLEIIKRYEGCRLKAYKCPAGRLTIGYGHTGGIKIDDVVTSKGAEELLKNDLKRFETMVNTADKYGHYNFNENEFSALVSFAFNIGSLKQLTQNYHRSKKEIAKAMLKYRCATVNGKKVVLSGLEKRRKEEVALFNTPVNYVSRETLTFEKVVENTIKGVYGNGFDRKQNIEKLGFSYSEVQKAVNKRLKK